MKSPPTTTAPLAVGTTLLVERAFVPSSIATRSVCRRIDKKANSPGYLSFTVRLSYWKVRFVCEYCFFFEATQSN